MTPHAAPTLSQFVNENPDQFKYDAKELAQLLQNIAAAAKTLDQEISKAGLLPITGSSGRQNTTGDDQQKLDELAHIRFSLALRKGGQVCALISEEAEQHEELTAGAQYVVAIDPLDGSSNIDVNISIGTIFSIYRRKTPVGQPVKWEDMLQKGADQVAAGYVLYGTSTMLVYTSAHGVNGFTYEAALDDFLLSHPTIKTPPAGNIYSVNEGQTESFQPPLKKYIQYCKAQGYTARYVGSLVADFHRNLLKGGIYIYPCTTKNPQGKLRLMYECNALAWIAEQAGGKASTGEKRILDLVPETLHQQVPFYIGSRHMVEQAEAS